MIVDDIDDEDDYDDNGNNDTNNSNNALISHYDINVHFQRGYYHSLGLTPDAAINVQFIPMDEFYQVFIYHLGGKRQRCPFRGQTHPG